MLSAMSDPYLVASIVVCVGFVSVFSDDEPDYPGVDLRNYFCIVAATVLCVWVHWCIPCHCHALHGRVR
jgi:hypothetical protein